MWFNICFEQEIDILLFQNFFFNSLLFDKYNLSILDSRSGTMQCINKIPNNKDSRADIVFNIDTFFESNIYPYSDVKSFAYLSIYDELDTFDENDIMLWFHELSTYLKSKIYIDFDEPECSSKFGLAWCIDGYKRSVVLDMEDQDNDIPYKRYMKCEST